MPAASLLNESHDRHSHFSPAQPGRRPARLRHGGVFQERQPVKGAAEYRAEYKGSTFLFATQANRDAFAADPARYAPQYGGYCAFGVSGGYKAATDPAAFSVVNGKLYLNYNRGVQKQWSADVPGFIARADRIWPAVTGQSKLHE